MPALARQALFATLLALGVTVAGTTGVALAKPKSAPVVQTQAPTAVAVASAVLHGLVDPGSQKTTYWFEIGTTTAYGTSTKPASAGNGDEAVTVNHGIGSLQPATTYHVQLVASNDDGVARGSDVTFTTTATADGATALPTPAAPSPLPGTELGPAPAAAPVLERSLAIARASGTVLVRVPGATRYAALSGSVSAPVGSVLDTRAGAVTLRTALPGGHTQTGTFHGGLFEVRQPAGGHGMTELVLRGALPTCSTGGVRAAAVTRKRPPRVLWGHDRHGRFRTRASNSVITVRGTTWYVADRCDGTLTRVTRGSVSVRDLSRRRTVAVRAGQHYLARRVG